MESPPAGPIASLISSDSPKESLNRLDWAKSIFLGAISSASVYLMGAAYVVVHSGAAYIFLDYLRLHSTTLIKDPYFAIMVAGVCTIATDLLHRYFDGTKVSEGSP